MIVCSTSSRTICTTTSPLRKAGLAERKRVAAAASHAALPQPALVPSGTLAGGTAFTTEILKGKGVLVDFWATYVPCVAELPRVKKMFAERHCKGLKIVGVSSDDDATVLNGFVAHENMR